MRNKMSFFSKLKSGLSDRINYVISGLSGSKDELLEELSEILILADTGMDTASKITGDLEREISRNKLHKPDEIKTALFNIVKDRLIADRETEIFPKVILVIGVNGVGKTTTTGKLAAYYNSRGKSVILCAADTFRAAAAEQLCLWSERAGVPIVKYGEGHDAAAVVYDALDSAKHKNIDVVIVDTAGRLHNKKNLMNELKKIRRVISGAHENCETLLVLDATTGLNSVNQAKQFDDIADVDGIILTKLDGTAKGGFILAIKDILNVPVRFIGVGEGLEDLQEFDAGMFAGEIIG